MNKPKDIFNSVQLGYVVIESRKLHDWRRFLKQGIGLHLAAEKDGLLAFRMDKQARRIIVREGDAEDVVVLGWQLGDRTSLAVVLERLAGRGIDVQQGSAREAAERGVESFHRMIGPKGIVLEFYTRALVDDSQLNMLTSGFETGNSGMGHVAISSRLPEKMLRFWQEILDARLSDRIAQPMGGTTLEVAFLRFNARHHTVAVAATRGLRLDPIQTRVQHINVLVATLEDLSAAFERLRYLGYEMAHEMGQHPNDKEISFYVMTPSGFEFEVGWDALKVDESNWKPALHDAISIWGHKPERHSR